MVALGRMQIGTEGQVRPACARASQLRGLGQDKSRLLGSQNVVSCFVFPLHSKLEQCFIAGIHFYDFLNT